MKKVIILLLAMLSLNAIAQNTITWSSGMNIAANSYDNLHPRIVIDDSGNPMVIWGRMSDKSVFFSRWNGVGFTAPVKLNPIWMDVATADWMGPDIASKGDTVYVVMKRSPEASDTNHIYITRSFNGGATFSTPARIDFIADSVSRFPTVTIDASGNPIVAFMKFDTSFGDARWVVTKSFNYGTTFSTDTKASGQSGGEVCDCCPGGITNSGNTVAMLYRTNISNIRDTWVGISSNNGNTFPNGYNIDQNNWMIMACPSTGPDGIIIGDTLYAVFMNEASGSARTYLSKSTISSSAVNSVNLLTGSIPGLAAQNYPRIDRFGNAAAIVWKQSVSGNDHLPVLFTNDITNGFPATYDTVDLSNITNTDVALSNGNIFVVWQDDNSGTVKYRTGTFTPLNTSVNENEENHLSVYPVPAGTEINIRPLSGEKFELEIFNTLGEAIIRSKNNNTIDISQLSNGIYFLKVRENKYSYSRKFIKR
ncbi:MAG: T9SS type A sorting domain-containing protein [Bacteroidetes bacterium]|nr:MAG: T9SS type A sorting domain-containing protein [Bacteroidota bacterium]